jgi:hypothetical protein
LQVKVHHGYQRRQWQICHRCQQRQWQIATSINNTSKTGVVDTDGKFATGVDTCGKFAAGIVDTGGNLPLISLTLVIVPRRLFLAAQQRIAVT